MKRARLFFLFSLLPLLLAASPGDSYSSKVYRHSVKLSLVSIASGDLSFHYEQYLGHKFSIEAGIGRTWSNALTEYFDLFTKELIAPPDRYGFGWSFKGQVRYYPMKDERGIKGSFVALEFGERNHVLEFDYRSGATGSANFGTTNYKLFQAAALMGITENGDSNRHWFYDFQIGFGLRKSSWFDTISSFILSPDFKNISFSPVALIGLKLGFGW